MPAGFVWIACTLSHSLDLFLVPHFFRREVRSLDEQWHESYLKHIVLPKALPFQSGVHQWQGILQNVKACRVQSQKKKKTNKNPKIICIIRECYCSNKLIYMLLSFKRETGSFHCKHKHLPLPQNTPLMFLLWFSSSHNAAGHWVEVVS